MHKKDSRFERLSLIPLVHLTHMLYTKNKYYIQF